MEVIGTTKISYEIEEMLSEANQFLILVTPYLKLTQRLKVRLSDAFKKVDNVYFLYRESQLNSQEQRWLKSFSNVHTYAIKNLHSKIYISESTAIISSMNLYEYSQINNHEIGVKLSELIDIQEFNDTVNEVRIIIESEYGEHNMDEVFDIFQNYSMGLLFDELTEKYTFGFFNKRTQEVYEFVCDRAREMVDFEEDELYQDDTAILRATQLGKKRYELLEKKLKALGKSIDNESNQSRNSRRRSQRPAW